MVKFDAECQAGPGVKPSVPVVVEDDISRYLSNPVEYHKHNVQNLEDSGYDNSLGDDVKEVQKYINQYRNRMIGGIKDLNEGSDPMSLKEIEARVKWRKMMNDASMDAEADAEPAEPDALVTTTPSKQNFYLRTQMVHGLDDRPTYLTVCKNKYGVDYP